MKPPYHPEHSEAIAFGASNLTVTARCGRHYAGPARRLGVDGVARDLVADLNAHRETYVSEEVRLVLDSIGVQS